MWSNVGSPMWSNVGDLMWVMVQGKQLVPPSHIFTGLHAVRGMITEGAVCVFNC